MVPIRTEIPCDTSDTSNTVPVNDDFGFTPSERSRLRGSACSRDKPGFEFVREGDVMAELIICCIEFESPLAVPPGVAVRNTYNTLRYRAVHY